MPPTIPTPQHNLLIPPIRIERHPVQRIAPMRHIKQLFIHLTITPSQRTIEQPIRYRPCIHKLHCMRSKLCHELQYGILEGVDGLGTYGGRHRERRRVLIERIEGIEAETCAKDRWCGLRETRSSTEGVVEVCYEYLLRVCAAEVVQLYHEL